MIRALLYFAILLAFPIIVQLCMIPMLLLADLLDAIAKKRRTEKMSYIQEYRHGDMDEEEFRALAGRFDREERDYERQMDFEPEDDDEEGED